jgi:hypothetical protein
MSCCQTNRMSCCQTNAFGDTDGEGQGMPSFG